MLAPLDWILLAVVLASLIIGAWRGLVYQVLSLLVWIAAFLLAQWLAPDVVPMLPVLAQSSETLRYAAAFVIVFIAAVFAGGLLAWLTKKLVEAIGLRPVDRTLGALFGVLRGLVVLLVAAVVVGMTPLKDSQAWKSSVGALALTDTLRSLRPLLESVGIGTQILDRSLSEVLPKALPSVLSGAVTPASAAASPAAPPASVGAAALASAPTRAASKASR